MSAATSTLVIAGAAVAAAGATAYAANESSSATKDATNASIAAQKSALTSQQQLAQPYVNAGTSSLSSLQKLLGVNADGSPSTAANSQQQQQTLASMPGYQFTQQQGIEATKNAASASGMSLSGNTLEALDQYNTGLADQTYQSEVGNLQNLTNTGQAAAAGQAANIGSSANNVSNSLINQGNTTATINANEIAGITRATGSAANQYATNQTLADIYGTQNTSPAVPAAVGIPGGYTGPATIPGYS